MAEQLNPNSTNRLFIDVEVEESVKNDAALAAKLEEVCPVDIFKNAGGSVEIVARTSTSASSASLCIEAAPAGTVHVKKLYDGTESPRPRQQTSPVFCRPYRGERPSRTISRATPGRSFGTIWL